MAIRIAHIQVNREGPLSQDFVLTPGDLNLIYGHNETGKTCVLESLIRLLFSTKKGSPFCQDLRDWRVGGRVRVSGLGPDPITFTSRSKKLEEYLAEQANLPQDICRLLVVRAGDTQLASDSDDGVGRDILKSFLSAGGMLDGIAGRISPTISAATVQDGQITASNRGEVRARTQALEGRQRADTLLGQVETEYASGHVAALKKDLEALEGQIADLVLARRHQAYLLNEQAEAHRQALSHLPDEDELGNMRAEVALHERASAELEQARQELQHLELGDEDYRWTKLALEDYDRISEGMGIAGASTLVLILAALGLLTTAVFAFVDGLRGVPLAIAAVLTLVFFVVYAILSQRAQRRVSSRLELQGTKEEFLRRFGAPLSHRAVLQSEYERLHNGHIRAEGLRERVDDIESDQQTRQGRIVHGLQGIVDGEVPAGEWRSVIREAMEQRLKEQEYLGEVELALARLSSFDELPLLEDPGLAWDADRMDELQNQRDTLTTDLRLALNDLEGLRDSIKRETASSASQWDGLIGDLQATREERAKEYRQLTAEILGKIQVTRVIDEFRQQENQRIAEGLKRPEISRPLEALTGHYHSVRLAADDQLVLVSDHDEEYLLSSVSTGAQEQAFLALRIGFASIAMDGQPAFLILDDAFQHSDWDRRKNLVAHMVQLVQDGWQVFYFTMDDNIRELFMEAGEALGERFRHVELD